MASPFPGMDPYLESHWGDVHTSLVTYARDRLNKMLPRDLRARVEERVVVEAPEEERRIVPDVRIHQLESAGTKRGRMASGVATADPVVVLLDEETVERFIEIRDASKKHQVVTVIEVLSPTNERPGKGQDEHLKKQYKLRSSGVSLVEIDLLRRGDRLLPFPVEHLRVEQRTPYLVCVSRAWKPRQVELYPMALAEPLPTIQIPLRPTDPDAPLNLQQLIEQCYENGSYTDDIDYRAEADPPLEGDDSRWANDLLRKQGQRPRNGAARKRTRRNGKRG